MSQFTTLLLFGVALIFLFFVFTQGWPEVCNNDTRQCPDNSFVIRDSLNNCEFYECPTNDYIGFCTQGVVKVDSFNEYVRVFFNETNFTVYNDNATDCPGAVECDSFSNLEWGLKVNCSLVDYSFYCPSDYEVIEGFKWITCEEPVPEKFAQYCEPWFRKWIMHNCPEINFI
jgi:hypothetical protein